MYLSKLSNIYYRGSLRSCNYACSYCPFAKHKASAKSLEEDAILFKQFCQFVQQLSHPVNILLIPYGEGLIHPYYQQAMISLAQLPQVKRISCQTNLSFPAKKFADSICACNIPADKIKLWASFHPEMVTPAEFAEKVHYLNTQGIDLCVGTVGNPVNKAVIAELRDLLSPEVYLFVNAMQGLKRKLTDEETTFFNSIDNLFDYDRKNAKADFARCHGGKGAMFINEQGDCFACPRSAVKAGNIFDKPPALFSLRCDKPICDCYIAYSNLPNTPLARMMGNGALWRIPQKQSIEAIFFDIDGTLTDEMGNIPANYAHSLQYWSEKLPLFVATALPLSYAKETLGNLFPLFKGGIFADGGHIQLGDKEQYIPLQRLPVFDENKTIKMTCHKNKASKVFKYSITAKSSADAQLLKKELDGDDYNLFLEKNLLTIVDKQADKANGVQFICQQLGINPDHVLSVGNTLHDSSMLSATGYSCAVLTADRALKQQATHILNPDRLAAFFKAK